MKHSRISNYFFLILVLFTCLEACKAKKIPPKPTPPAPDSAKVAKVVEAPKPQGIKVLCNLKLERLFIIN